MACGSSNIFRGRSGTHCGSSLDCCASTMPLPSYFTGSFAFLPLPLNLLIFCPVLFPLLPPLIGPCVATCHLEHGSCSFASQDLLSKFDSKLFVKNCTICFPPHLIPCCIFNSLCIQTQLKYIYHFRLLECIRSVYK